MRRLVEHPLLRLAQLEKRGGLGGERLDEFHLTEQRADDQHFRDAADLLADVRPAPATGAFDVENLLGQFFAAHETISEAWRPPEGGQLSTTFACGMPAASSRRRRRVQFARRRLVTSGSSARRACRSAAGRCRRGALRSAGLRRLGRRGRRPVPPRSSAFRPWLRASASGFGRSISAFGAPPPSDFGPLRSAFGSAFGRDGLRPLHLRPSDFSASVSSGSASFGRGPLRLGFRLLRLGVAPSARVASALSAQAFSAFGAARPRRGFSLLLLGASAFGLRLSGFAARPSLSVSAGAPSGVGLAGLALHGRAPLRLLLDTGRPPPLPARRRRP